MPRSKVEKLHAPARWKFEEGPAGAKACHGEFILWVQECNPFGWRAGFADGGGPLAIVYRVETRAKAIAAAQAAAVAGGWLLPRKAKEAKRGKGDA